MKVKLICSENDEQRKVYGIVYMPDTVDAHGDYADAETIEKAAHDFIANYRKMDIQHNMEDGAGVIVESSIAPVDFVVNGEEIKKGTWVIASIASEPVWERIKKGELNSYSLYGTAEVEQERMGFLDLFMSLFKHNKINISNMEVSMDEELKKILESIAKSISGKTIQEVIKESLNEYFDEVKKELSEVKKTVEDIVSKIGTIPTAETIKSIGTIDNVEIEKINTKIDGIIETLSGSIFSKRSNSNDDNDESESRERIL